MDNAVAWVISALGGGGIFTGITAYLMQRYINKRLTEIEENADRLRVARIEITKIETKTLKVYGRLLFWLYKAITTGKSNGELEQAYSAFKKVEDIRDEWEDDALAEVRIEK